MGEIDDVISMFIERQIKLLDAEYKEELEESDLIEKNSSLSVLDNRGLVVSNLKLETSYNIHGKFVVEFHREGQTKLLEQLQTTTGDIVNLMKTYDMKREFIATAVVMMIAGDKVSLSFEKDICSHLKENESYFIIKKASYVTFRRMKNAIQQIRSLKYNEECGNLVHLVFGTVSLESCPLDSKILDDQGQIKFINGKLNYIQKVSVEFALKQKQLAIIHGPPGTGKTTTLVEIILQLITLGKKILVCAPSNIAVDTILERLLLHKTRVVRLGHPARMLNSIKCYSLDAAVSTGSSAAVLRDIKKELSDCERDLKNIHINNRSSLGRELKALKRELHHRLDIAQKEVLLGTSVILTTLITASNEGPLKDISADHFDVVIIDESSQALEAACWIALPRAPKVILAGDHLQLPPVIKSKQAAEGGLNYTLMERFIEKFGGSCYKLLTLQFRMHKDIMSWVSQIYANKLEAHISVKEHLLKDIPGVEETEETVTPLLFVNTAGCDAEEMDHDESESKANDGEANIVALLVKRLLKAGVNEESLSVITPYSLQVLCIKSKLTENPGVEVRTVDGFQGREKEAVIISFVRSNFQHELGFVTEKRRLNVAVSRARRFLAIVGDSSTVGCDKNILSLIEHIEQHGIVHSAHEYLEEINNSDNIPRFMSTSEKKSASTKKSKTAQKKLVQEHKEQIQSMDSTKMKGVPDWKETESKWISRLKEIFEVRKLNYYRTQCNLSSFDRRLVHEAAEALGLQHTSVGEGNKRHVVLRKLVLNAKSRDDQVSIEQTSCEGNANNAQDRPRSQIAEKVKNSKCIAISSSEPTERKQSLRSIIEKHEKSEDNIPENGYETGVYEYTSVKDQNTKKHSAGSNKSPRTDETEHEVPKKQLSTRSKTYKSAHKGSLELVQGRKESAIAENDENDHFNELLREFKKKDSTCSVPSCKTSIKLMPQKCQFCCKLFCLHHHLPEIHGCGNAAKKAARQSFIHPEPTRMREEESRKACMKLKKKLAEMSDNRKPQKPK